MRWVGSGEDFCGLGWVQKFWVGLGFEKVTHDQLCFHIRGKKTTAHVISGYKALDLRSTGGQQARSTGDQGDQQVRSTGSAPGRHVSGSNPRQVVHDAHMTVLLSPSSIIWCCGITAVIVCGWKGGVRPVVRGFTCPRVHLSEVSVVRVRVRPGHL